MLKLGQLIGEGAFARVFAAEYQRGRFSRRVALRIPRSPGQEQAWAREAALLACIDHPGVVRIHDFLDSFEGLPAQVLERLDGPSLHELRQTLGGEARPPLPLPAVVRIGARVAEALHAIHEAKGGDGRPLDMVHRDLSPDNVLLDRHGEPRLIDLGAARVQAQRSTSGIAKVEGKAAFMAPERLRGQPVDRRADVYALGTVLGFLLSESGTARTEDVPEPLLQVVLRCRADDPRRRPPDALEVARALEALTAPMPGWAWQAWLSEAADPPTAPRSAPFAEMFDLGVAVSVPVLEHTEHHVEEALQASTTATALPDVEPDLTEITPAESVSGWASDLSEPTALANLSGPVSVPRLRAGLVPMADLGGVADGTLFLARTPDGGRNGIGWVLFRRLGHERDAEGAARFFAEVEALRQTPHPLLARPLEIGLDADGQLGATFEHRLDSRSFVAIFEALEGASFELRLQVLLTLGAVWAEALLVWRQRTRAVEGALPVDPGQTVVDMDGRAWLWGLAVRTGGERRIVAEPEGRALRRFLLRQLHDVLAGGGNVAVNEFNTLLDPARDVSLESLVRGLGHRVTTPRQALLAQVMGQCFG